MIKRLLLGLLSLLLVETSEAQTIVSGGSGSGSSTPIQVQPFFPVANVAALKALNVTGFTLPFTISLSGYYTQGDKPAVLYNLQASTCTNADNGSQIQSSVSSYCWVIGSQPKYNITDFGAVSSTFSTAVNSISGDGIHTVSTITLANAGDFQNTQPVDLYGMGAAPTFSAPTGLTLTTTGISGSTTYCVRIVRLGLDHSYSASSGEVCDSTGNSVLSTKPATNGADPQGVIAGYTPPGSNEAAGYAFYIGNSNAEVCVGTVLQGQTTYGWYGQFSANNACPGYLPSSYPTVAGNALLGTVIQSGAGTTTLTVPILTSGTVALTGVTIAHENSNIIQNALNAESIINIPCGDYHLAFHGLVVGTSGDGSTLEGDNKFCSNLTVDGGFDVVALGRALTAQPHTPDVKPRISGVTAKDFSINALGLMSGNCWTINTVNFTVMTDLQCNNPFRELTVANTFQGSITRIKDTSERRGDYGWFWFGSDDGVTALATIYVISDSQIAGAAQGYSWWVDGAVQSLRTNQMSIEQGWTEYYITNLNGSGIAPTYNIGNNIALNECIILCLNYRAGTGLEWSDSYIQGVSNASNVANIYINTGVTRTRFSNGTIFGGTYGIDFNGFGLRVDNVAINNNVVAEILCGQHAQSMIAIVDSNFNMTSGTAVSGSDYGIELDNGCENVTVEGKWQGQLADVWNQLGNNTPVLINGIRNPIPNVMYTGSGNKLVDTATNPRVYTGTIATPVELDLSGNNGDTSPLATLQWDTATHIINSLDNPYVGEKTAIEVHNHSNNDLTVITNTGITLAGQNVIKNNANAVSSTGGVTNMESTTYVQFTVTSTTTPAVIARVCTITTNGGC